MEREHASPGLESVLLERTWLRRLARELLGDASAADDLAQEAWLVARDGPARPGPRAPWLRGVLRRLARQRRRADWRRERRERGGARPEQLPAADELAERAELQRRVAAAVLALREPYRTAVLLRYFDDSNAAEIARRLGVPAATVRSRLARGLEQLRVALDAERPEGRAAWAPVLASWLAPRALPAATGAALIGGLLTMKVLLSAAVAAIAAIGLWFAFDGVGAQRAVAPISSAAAPAEETLEALPLAEADAQQRAALELAPAAAERSSTQASPPPAPSARAPLAVVEARLVDERGRPLALGELSARVVSPEGSAGRASSDATGFARLELELPGEVGSARIRARAPGRAALHLETRITRGATTQLGELMLSAAGRVAGRVVDPAGAPLADVTVLVGPASAEAPDPGVLRRHGPDGAELLPSAATAADGSFAIDEVPHGSARVWAGGGRFAWSSAGPLDVIAGGATEDIRLVVRELHPHDLISGILLDPDGRPVPHASALFQYMSDRHAAQAGFATDAEGRFELLLDQRVPHDFEFSDPQRRYSDLIVLGVEPGTRDLELRFAEPRWIAVRARDAEGEAVLELSAQAQHRARGYQESMGSAVESDLLTGVAKLLAPSLEFEVVVDAKGYALAVLGPFEPERAPDEIVASLVPLPGVRGVVLDGDEPVAGARVMLERVLPLDRRYLVDGFRSLTELEDRDYARTDAAGRFYVDLREGGEFMLRAEHGERALAELGPLALDPAEGADGLELRFPARGAIEGRLALASGASPAGCIVGINHGDGRPRTTRVDEDGRYRFEGLAPGMWQVLLREEEVVPGNRSFWISTGSGPEPLEWSCEVFAGETTRFDLREGRETCVLVGRFALGDAPLAGWSAELTPPDGVRGVATPEVAPVAADGGFRLTSPRAGAHVLMLSAPAGERGGLVLQTHLQLDEGEREWSVVLPAGALEGEGARRDAAVETALEYRWESQLTAGLEASARIVAGEDGRFALPLVPAGEARIVGYSTGADGASRWFELARVQVEPGGSARAVLP